MDSITQFGCLTPVCLTSVFSNLSLMDLFSCSQVNRYVRAEVITFSQINVRSLQITTFDRPMALDSRRDYSRRLIRQLEVNQPFPDESRKANYSLYLRRYHFPLSLAQTLGYFAPNLNKLDIHIEILDDEIHFGFVNLLHHVPSLVSLVLTIEKLDFFPEFKRARLQQLFNGINSLQKLEKLKICLSDDCLVIEPDLRCLAWLHELSFETRDNRDVLFRSFCDYGATNGHLRAITYRFYCNLLQGFMGKGRWMMRRYAGSPEGRRVARRFTIIPFCESIRNSQLSQYVRLLPSLTYLELNAVDYPQWHQTMRQLAALRYLIDLVITTYTAVGDEPLDPAMLLALPRLWNIRTLVFIISDFGQNSHSRLAALYNLYHFFPRLQLLRLEYQAIGSRRSPLTMCEQCQQELERVPPMVNATDLDQFKMDARIECARAVIGDWRASGTLRYVSVNRNRIDLTRAFES